ncbi:MAG: PTS sugar transporter subunit IIA [Lacrimispora celerecrescens]|nr:PTS sugar transporter subunit IIA [Lacrimispora celerecrescens]
MQLKDVLDERIIRIGLDVKDKNEALNRLSQLLYENHYIDNVDEFVKDIYLREAEGVTGIGGGIAIPHGKSLSAKQPGIAIATLKAPIQWETLDEGDVDTIFLFCVNADKDFGRNHMLLLSKVAAKLADDELIHKIRKVSSCKEMISYLTGEKI